MPIAIKIYLRQQGLIVEGTSPHDKDFVALAKRLIGGQDCPPPGFLHLENGPDHYLVNLQAIDCIIPVEQELPPNESNQKFQETVWKSLEDITQQLEAIAKKPVFGPPATAPAELRVQAPEDIPPTADPVE